MKLKKLLLILLLFPAFSFAQTDTILKKKSAGKYLTMGMQLETPKYFGAKINFGVTGNNKNGHRFIAVGLGLDVIRYNDPGLETTAFPIYFDIRYFLPIVGSAIFIDGNGGYYNYSNTFSTKIPSSDGGYVKTDATTKGQSFFGAALGFVVPFRKSNLHNGIYVMAGYRNVTYNTITKTEKKERLRNGEFQITSRDGLGSHFGNGMFVCSIGVSIF